MRSTSSTIVAQPRSVPSSCFARPSSQIVSEIITEAFERCLIHPAALTRHQWISARRSINLELQTWSNRGINLWEVIPWTVQLVAGQATYTAGAGVTNIPSTCQSMLDVYYSIVNGYGSGINNDRIMVPIGRTQYAELPNKLTQGVPTVFWYQKLEIPQITIWEVPLQGYPTVQLSGYCLSRIQDASPTMGQTPDIPYRFNDALIAGIAARLALKFAPERYALLKGEAKEAWEEAADADREDVPMYILPQLGAYFD